MEIFLGRKRVALAFYNDKIKAVMLLYYCIWDMLTYN
jgi:hypothetical protein